MTIVTATIKGQVVIPANIRKKFGIVKGTPIHIYEEDNKIVVEPVHNDPIKEGKGMLKSKGGVLKQLMADRKEEALK